MIVYCIVLVHVVFIHGQFKGTKFSGTNMKFRQGRYDHAVNFLKLKKIKHKNPQYFVCIKILKVGLKIKQPF